MTRKTILPGLIPIASQRIALNGTAVSLNSTIRSGGAQVVDISAETQAARYLYGTPTMTTGVLVAANSWIRMDGYNGTSILRFVAATGGAILNVQAYKYAGQV